MKTEAWDCRKEKSYFSARNFLRLFYMVHDEKLKDYIISAFLHALYVTMLLPISLSLFLLTDLFIFTYCSIQSCRYLHTYNIPSVQISPKTINRHLFMFRYVVFFVIIFIILITVCCFTFSFHVFFFICNCWSIFWPIAFWHGQIE